MSASDIIVLILAIVGVYHIIEELAYKNFVKENKEFLKDFSNEYEKKENNKWKKK